MNHSAPAGVVTGWVVEPAGGHDNQTKRLIGSSVALIALSTIFVFLRLVSRKLSKAGFWVCSLQSSSGTRGRMVLLTLRRFFWGDKVG